MPSKIVKINADLRTSISKISPLVDVTKAVSKYSLDKQHIMDRVSKSVSAVIAFQDALPAISNIINNRDAITSQINNILQSMPAIFDAANFVSKNLSNFVNYANIYANALTALDSAFSRYDSIIEAQKQALMAIDYLLPYQKRFLLRIEQNQKDTLLLKPSDFQYASVINTNMNNTVSLVNQFSGIQKDPDVIPIAEEPELYDFLYSMDKAFLNMLRGAKQTAENNSADKARQVVISLRELLRGVINHMAPHELVDKYCKNSGHDHKGKSPLDCAVHFIFQKIPDTSLEPFIKDEINSIPKLFKLLSDTTHEIVEKYSRTYLLSLIHKVESILFLLIKYSSISNQEEPYSSGFDKNQSSSQEPPHA
jgi:hypothetical protein